MHYQKHQTLSGELNKFQTLSGKLSWSHYIELLGINEKMERDFRYKFYLPDRKELESRLRKMIEG